MGHLPRTSGRHGPGGGPSTEVPVDGSLQVQRADLGVELDEFGHLAGIGSPGIQQSLEWGARGVVYTTPAVAHLDLAGLLHDGLEAVVEGTKQVGVELVQPDQLAGAVHAEVADE